MNFFNRNALQFKKIKPVAEWIVSIVLRLRLRKTYWSIAVPCGLFLVGEVVKNLDFIIQITGELSNQSESAGAKIFWRVVNFYFSFGLPWWSYALLVLILIFFTYVYLQELKAKKWGYEVSVESITNSILSLSTLQKKIDTQLNEIKSELIFQPTSEWFQKQCISSVQDLGSRYTPELNFELELSKIFEGLGRTEAFKNDLTTRFDRLIIKGKKALFNNSSIQTQVKVLEENFDTLYKLFLAADFQGTEPLPISSFQESLKQAEDATEVIYNYFHGEERKLQQEKNEYQYYHKYGSELRHIREFENELHSFIEFITSITARLANNPCLILDGEAGIGKSHLIGDIVTRRIKNHHDSVFLLGQHFVTDEDPWTQIFKRLQINSKSETFLFKLNEHGKATGKRIILFIDAINEGRGRYFWVNHIKSFINEIKAYQWLGLVITIRSSYKALIFQESETKDLQIIKHTIYGFKNFEYEASKLFFNNYKIELPNVPLLHPEFENPLFLKLFCEGINKSGQTKIPDGLQGITSIITFFISSVNNVLAKPNKADYSNSLNLVKRSIDALIKYKIENQLRYISYEKAYEIIEDSVSKFLNKKGFIDDLIAEGVLSKNLFWKENDESEEGVYLSYERFEDHLTSLFLLEQNSNLETAFKEGGGLHNYVKDIKSVNINRGIIDAFSIQVPERSGKELSEFIPSLEKDYPIVESFIESLLWRKVETINEKSKDFVNKYVSMYQGTYDFFWETILAVTAIPGHYFNAYSLHNHLMKFSLPERDAEWTQSLKNKYSDDSSVKRLIDWAWNETDKSHISNESIKLTSIALSWFHTSTNRKLRDCATKALVCLLQERLSVLIEVLKMFENVNDPYVYERLFAVAYGCSIRTSQKELLKELSEYIFETIFKEKEEVYPHALLRDYARGVIEFTNYSGIQLSLNLDFARPPYKSVFPENILTNEEIDAKYKFDYNAENFKKIYWSQNTILDSMVTEYGRGISGYGDFGRYTFQSALRTFDVNPNTLSNLAVEWIFEKYGYNVEVHGKYDRDTGSSGRSASIIERIGKKYQWIALHEMVARVSDNFIKNEGWGREKKEVKYQGPWAPYIRDIDPTMLISETGAFDEDKPSNYWWLDKTQFNWSCSNKDWVKNSQVLPEIDNLVQVKDQDSNEWIILEGFPEWAEPKKIGEEKWDQPHKRLWCQVRSYIVKNNEYDQFKDWAIEQDFMGRWMPENGDRYEIFSREYYWSPAHKYFLMENDSAEEWREVYDKETGKFIADVLVTAENFLWEEEFDKSKKETISFLKPCSEIYHGMKLKYSLKEGEFLDTKNEMVCFAADVNNNSKSYLLIKKAPFLKYLDENDLKIIWTILGEKQIIGGRTSGDEYEGRLEISGAYYFLHNKLQGKIHTKNS